MSILTEYVKALYIENVRNLFIWLYECILYRGCVV